MHRTPYRGGPARANRPTLAWGKIAVALSLATVCVVGGVLLWGAKAAPPPGYDHLVAAARLADEEPYATASKRCAASRDPRNDLCLAQMRQTVAKNRQAIASLHAAVAEPCWVPYGLTDTLEDSHGMDDIRARRLARVLSMDCRLHQADRDWAGSIDPGLDCLAMGLNMERGLDVTAALCGDAVVSIGLQPLWFSVPNLDSSSARAAALRVEALAENTPTYAQLLTWWTPPIARLHARDRGLPADNGLPSPRERRRQMTVWLTSLRDAVEKPYNQYVPPSAQGLEWAAREGQTWAESRYKWPAMAANLRLLSANLALQAYHAEHGHYPDSLAELVPSNLRHLPPDPFTSGPLRYRRDGTSFLCWSIGPDGRDDQARRVTRGERNSPATGVYVVEDTVGDIVTP